MTGAGIFVLWLGYAVGYWGLTFLHGTSLGFLTIAKPGKWTKQAAATQPAAKPAPKGKS
ncbi:MAG: hypothetical protein M0Z46_10525 [Actinomycetota bacterium]|jgi:hypothetical protein|nr:hypothetical protein [Actinomycetota bacterium]